MKRIHEVSKKIPVLHVPLLSVKSLRPQVSLFIPCYIDQFFPDTGRNLLRVLEKAGCEVSYQAEQTCCGQPAFHAGYWDMAKEVGEKFIQDFSIRKYIVSPSGACTGMVREGYNTLFVNTALHNQCKNLQKNLFEFSEFWVKVLENPDIQSHFPARITFLDSCQAMRQCGIRDEPRQVLAKVKGVELAEMHPINECCGFGGVFSIKNDELSILLAEKTIERALETGAEFIVSTDMGCLMHLNAYLAKHHSPIKTLHLVDLLAKAI